MKKKVAALFSDREGKRLIHGKFAAGCFNECWSYIEKKDRSEEDVENMLLTAQASLWHWKQREDCTPMNLSVGYWQVSRVFALASEGRLAERYAKKCLAISQEGNLAPFYVGYAQEALARAALGLSHTDQAKIHIGEVEEALNHITDKDERSYLQADFEDLQKIASK